MHINFLNKSFVGLLVLSFIVSSCASPTFTYDEKVLADRHFIKVDPKTLNCKQLNETRIQISTLIDGIADKLLTGKTKSNANMFVGIGTQNPEVGENFFGFKSSETPRELNEYRELKLFLEEVEDIQVAKCIRTSLDQ
ncbi:MAG: hypothetical protein QF527_01770 [SAR86 cluster bacterium]|jgi:hypothetical protein|nr:hypothetical protein [SAR86 cluster bacterium]